MEEGAIIPRDKDEATEESMQVARNVIKEKARTIDYRDELLRKFRDKYFTYMKEHYDLFSEHNKEIGQGLKMK